MRREARDESLLVVSRSIVDNPESLICYLLVCRRRHWCVARCGGWQAHTRTHTHSLTRLEYPDALRHWRCPLFLLRSIVGAIMGGADERTSYLHLNPCYQDPGHPFNPGVSSTCRSMLLSFQHKTRPSKIRPKTPCKCSVSLEVDRWLSCSARCPSRKAAGDSLNKTPGEEKKKNAMPMQRE